MSLLITIFALLQFAIISFLGYKLYNLSYKKVEEDVVKDKIVLKKIKGSPDYTKDVDPNYELLKNVIKSAKLEEWETEIDARAYYYRLVQKSYYDINLKNAVNTVSIRCRLRMGEESVGVTIFQISRNGIGTINFDDKKAHYLILNFMWDYVLDHHQKLHDECLEHYKKMKESISKELKTLNRDKQLEKLLEDE